MENKCDNFFQGLRRLVKVSAHQHLAGLNPFCWSLSSPFVHTRFLTAEERHSRQIKSEASQLKYQLNRSQRRVRTQSLGRNICLSVSRIGFQQLQLKIKRQNQINQKLRAEGIETASEVVRASLKNQQLETDISNAHQQLIKATNERDQMFSMLQMEKKKSEAKENLHTVEISSLQSRLRREKESMEVEIEMLQKEVQKQRREADEARSYAYESHQDAEELERRVVRLEQNEVISHVSQHLSGFLSDISKVVLVRPADLLTVEDKLFEIGNCVKDMVKEIERRRRDFDALREKVFNLEEEKELLTLGQSGYAQELRLQNSLFETSREIAMLRQGEQGNGAAGSSSEEIGVPPGFPPLWR